jgi:multicomponent Na+:H+ antiporter subunit B
MSRADPAEPPSVRDGAAPPGTPAEAAPPGAPAEAAPPGAPAEAAEQEPEHRRWLGAILTAGMAAALGAAMIGIPREHAALPAVARYALDVSLPRWGLTEPVNEIVYGTRGFDTFGETFLLLAAVISVVLITRSREARRGYFGESLAGEREQAQADPAQQADTSERAAREAERREQGGPAPGDARGPATPDATPLGTPAPETADAMTVVVRTAIRIALPVLAVAGLYLVAWGYSPGGGFPGGAVILGVLLLVYAGFGRRRISAVIRPGLLEAIELAGAGAIILTELLGLALRGSFSANWLPLAAPATILSGGIAQLFSGSELIEVGTGLAIAVFALIGMGHDWSPDADDQGGPR